MIQAPILKNNILTKVFHKISNILWDLWCIVSVIGIWPRFIEPRLLTITRRTIAIDNLPADLTGLSILHFSDLHYDDAMPEKFLNKIERRIRQLAPDLIIFSGDFLRFSNLKNPYRLQKFLNHLQAPYGCYAVSGNHDYHKWVSLTSEGVYGYPEKKQPAIVKGFKKLFSKSNIKKGHPPYLPELTLHPQLKKALEGSPCSLLENECHQVKIKGSYLNICGLGDYWAGRCQPEKAFKIYDSHYPGIIISHNPDSIELLQDYPGELLLSGHTHGGQVNLPFLARKLTPIKNHELKYGYKTLYGKQLFISRGVGCNPSFRWFAPPELVLINLKRI
ncbi:MAG: UDP-2,3-diacylglucosamine diphosphatase LpxG [Chlamydiota bacterium]